MLEHGNSQSPILLIHGGADDSRAPVERSAKYRTELNAIAVKVGRLLFEGASSLDAVCLAVKLLENCPVFNAGFGSELQSDGVARLSASVMESVHHRFSAVSLATDVKNPVLLARELQTRENRSLGPVGIQLLARELGMKPEDPVSDDAIAAWVRARNTRKSSAHGTVGAVAKDVRGNLAASTSTGGHATAYPGRMSDVSTPAGNYATRYAALSCTGIGEQILDDGLCVRLETRVRDGMSIADASAKCITEAKSAKHLYGWIGIDHESNWAYAFSTIGMNLAVFHPHLPEPHVLTL